jgi:predicted XRE-type DNA-binding protein
MSTEVSKILELVTTDPVKYQMHTLKERLASAITNAIKQRGWKQNEAAKVLGVSAPRLNTLVKGHYDLFSVDVLMEMMLRLGFRVDSTVDPVSTSKPFKMELRVGV